MRPEHPFFSWQVEMMTEPLCGGFIHPPYHLLRTLTFTLAHSAILIYRAPGKSEGSYAGRGLSKPLIAAGGEVRPNGCQRPMNHINRKNDKPKIEVSILPDSSIVCFPLHMNPVRSSLESRKGKDPNPSDLLRR